MNNFILQFFVYGCLKKYVIDILKLNCFCKQFFFVGNPDELVSFKPVGKVSPAMNWREISYLTPLNLTYDVTPPDLVTAVVTELAILPCTSVPVILRIKPSESGC